MPNFSAQFVKGVQGIGYVLAFLLAMVICVPMSMHQDQFKGRCLLFSTGTWQEKDGQLKVDWASQAYCNFTIFVSTIMFVISLFQFIRFLKFFFKGRDSSFLSAFVDVIVCAFMCIMTITSALFVTLGFKVWCEEITKRFENCSDAVGDAIAKSEGIDAGDFFNQMFTAQFGVWTSFTVWFTLLVFSVVKLCGYHHMENLRVSVARERKRLINEDLVSEVPNAGPSNQHHVHSQPFSRHKRRFARGKTDTAGAVDGDDSDIGVVDDEVVIRQGHQGPFDDDVPIILNPNQRELPDEVEVQQQIQARLENHENSSPNSSGTLQGCDRVSNHSAGGQPGHHVNGSEHDRNSNASIGSSQVSASGAGQIHGNQIRIDHLQSDPTNPWN